jgi:hypothetical protein
MVRNFLCGRAAVCMSVGVVHFTFFSPAGEKFPPSPATCVLLLPFVGLSPPIFLAKTFNAAIIFDNNFDAGGFDRVPSLARPRCQHFEHLADEGKTPGPLLILDEEKRKKKVVYPDAFNR